MVKDLDSIISCQTAWIGKNERVVQKLKIDRVTPYYDGKTVHNVPGAGASSVSAVIFTNENNKQAINYSNLNEVVLTHKKLVTIQLKDEKKIKLSLERYFYEYSTAKACIAYNPLSVIFTMGASMGMSPESYGNQIVIEKKKDGSYDGRGSFAKKFKDGEELNLLLSVTNTGNKSAKKPFIIVDTLPNYLKFISAGYQGPVKKVSFDKHIVGNNQILVFKVYPEEDGFDSLNRVNIKIKTKPDLQLFLSAPYIKK